jgi:hypothetical protein
MSETGGIPMTGARYAAQLARWETPADLTEGRAAPISSPLTLIVTSAGSRATCEPASHAFTVPVVRELPRLEGNGVYDGGW